jgi:hypothetical protein
MGLVLAVWVTLGAGPFERVDGGYALHPAYSVDRTVGAFFPDDLSGTFRFADSVRPDTFATVTLTSPPSGHASLQGDTLSYGPSLTITACTPQQVCFDGPSSQWFASESYDGLGTLARDGGTPLALSGTFAPLGNTGAQGFTGARFGLSALSSTPSAVPVTHGPFEPVYGANLAWDPNRQTLIRFGGAQNYSLLPGASPLDAGTLAWDPVAGWYDLNLPSPSPRARAAMTWDSTHQRFVLFGGTDGLVFFDDTWLLDATGWHEVLPAHRPPGRWTDGIAYDEGRRRVVLFGGESSQELGDLWEFDGTDWTEVPGGGLGRPTARDSFGFAYDPLLGEVVLFGGFDQNHQYLADTWSFDGTRWLQRTTTSQPEARSSTVMVWDPVTQGLVLVGGWDLEHPSGPLGTWRFTGADWVPVTTAPPLGEAQVARMGLAVHPTLGLLAQGGVTAGGQLFADLWRFDGAWRLANASHAVVYERGALHELTGPFGYATLATQRRDVWAIARADGGTLGTWQRTDAGWSLVDDQSTPRDLTALALDPATEHLWGRRSGGSVLELTSAGWAPRLDGGVRDLSGAPDGGLLLVAGDVLHYDGLTPPVLVAPAPSPAATHVLVDSLGRLVANTARANHLQVWAFDRWEDLEVASRWQPFEPLDARATDAACGVAPWLLEADGALWGRCGPDLGVRLELPPPGFLHAPPEVPDAGELDAGAPDDAGSSLDAGPSTRDAGPPVADAGDDSSEAPKGCGCQSGGELSVLAVVLLLGLRRVRG